MQKSFQSGIKYKVAAVCFVLGVLVLLIPFSQKGEILKLPETGTDPELEVELTVDKSDVQRDDPTEGEQIVTYQIKVTNLAECIPIPVNLMLVNDKSGSMLDLMDDAKQASIALIQNLDFTIDHAGVVAYADNAYLVQGLTNSESTLINAVNSLSAEGWTNIGDGIGIATNELLAASNASEVSPVIVIFTDGRANRPLGVDPVQYTIDKAAAAKNAGIRIISIAFGAYADQDLMQQVASPGTGNYYFAPTGADMIAIYSEICKDLRGDSPDTEATLDLSVIENIVDIESISQGGTYSNGQLSWDLGTLECLESVILEFSLRVHNNASDLDILNLIATASNSAGYTAQSANAVTTIHAPALNLSKTDNKDEAMPGEELNYEIVVENVGTGNAYGVVITDTLPEAYFGIMPRSISDNGALIQNRIVWDNNGDGYIFDGSFEPTGSILGSSHTFRFSGDVEDSLDPGFYIVHDDVVLTTANGHSQSAFDETEIPYGPDLSITKGSDPPVYTYPGGDVTYTLYIKNNGNVAATGVAVIDDYSEYYLTVVPEGGSVQGGTIVWQVGDFAIDEERTFTYQSHVRDDIVPNSVTIPNEAIVTLREQDINPSDNIALHEIIATKDPVLTITKTSDKTTYEMDEEIEYTIVITNESYADAYNLVLEDLIPFEFDYIPGTAEIDGTSLQDPTGTYELTWEIGDLGQGESVTITFKVKPNDNCTENNYTATAAVSWEDEQGNPFGPASASCTVTVVEADLGIGDIEPGGDTLADALEDIILGNLAKAGSFVYLKVFLGIVLALPLPLMLVFERSEGKKAWKKQRKVRKKKPAKKRKTRVRATKQKRKRAIASKTKKKIKTKKKKVKSKGRKTKK